MSETIAEAEFKTWEACQPLAFELADGRLNRRPDECQGPARLARVQQIARKVMAGEEAVAVWMSTPEAGLGGLEPETLAADSEEGCQLVLRMLVAMGRRQEAGRE